MTTTTTKTKTKDERILDEIEDCYQCALKACEGNRDFLAELEIEWTPTAVDYESIVDCVPCDEDEVFDALKIWRRKTGIRSA